jgi:hypothetical protein
LILGFISGSRRRSTLLPAGNNPPTDTFRLSANYTASS